MSEVVRNALIDGQGADVLASVLPTTLDPSKNGLVVTGADGGAIPVSMSGDIEIGAVELKNGTDDTRAIINAANTARSISNPVLLVQNVDPNGSAMDFEVSSGNSTTTPLIAGATFVGSTIDMLNYGSIAYSTISDVASASNSVRIERSPDGTNRDRRTTNDYDSAHIGTVIDLLTRKHDRYARIRYTNGSNPQTYFRFHTIIGKLAQCADTRGADHPPVSGDDALLTKAIMTGKSSAGGGTYVDVKVNPSGTLEVNANQSTASNLNAQVVGTVADNGVDSGNPVKVGGKYNATLPTYADGDRADLQVDSRGRLVTASTGINGSLTTASFKSPYDFTATYTSNVTITVTNAPFTVDDTVCTITDIRYKPNGGSWTTLTNGGGGVSITASSNVITVSGAGTPFASGDTYKIGIDYQQKTYDLPTDTQKVTNQNPESSYYVQIEGVDTTNVTAATSYYPSSLGDSMDQYKHLSLTGKFIDADNKIVMTIEATNDEDQTNADRVQVYAKNWNTGFEENQRVASNGTLTFALSLEHFNFQYFRIKVVNLDNTNTCIIKYRKLY